MWRVSAEVLEVCGGLADRGEVRGVVEEGDGVVLGGGGDEEEEREVQAGVLMDGKALGKHCMWRGVIPVHQEGNKVDQYSVLCGLGGLEGSRLLFRPLELVG